MGFKTRTHAATPTKLGSSPNRRSWVPSDRISPRPRLATSVTSGSRPPWSRPIQPFGHKFTIDMDRKLGGGCCVHFRGELGLPSNTMWHGMMPTSVPSGIFIHSAVWPQYTNVAERTYIDRQDNGPILRTVLQTVAQKSQEYYNIMACPLLCMGGHENLLK